MTTRQPGGQLRAPGQELVAAQRAVRQGSTGGIDGVNLDHALGQINADSNGWNLGILVHGLPLSTWLQIDDSNHQSWRIDAVA